MEYTDPSADPVQPDQGQGDGGTSDAPYSEYLNRIPEEVRGQVEPVFKEWDGQVTRRFQEASEYKKQWEPYEQLGVNQQPPEAVQWGLQFLDAVQNNPQAIQEWYGTYAQEQGLTPQEAQQQLEQNQQFEDYGSFEQTEQLKSMLQQQLSPLQQQMQQFIEWRQQQEQQAQVQEAERYIEGQLKSLEEKHGGEFNREWVEKFVGNHIETNPQQAVQLAWQDYQNMKNQLEKQVLQSKVDAPFGAETGGVADTAAEPASTLKDAGAQLMAQLREANRQ